MEFFAFLHQECYSQIMYYRPVFEEIRNRSVGVLLSSFLVQILVLAFREYALFWRNDKNLGDSI